MENEGVRKSSHCSHCSHFSHRDGEEWGGAAPVWSLWSLFIEAKADYHGGNLTPTAPPRNAKLENRKAQSQNLKAQRLPAAEIMAFEDIRQPTDSGVWSHVVQTCSVSLRLFDLERGKTAELQNNSALPAFLASVAARCSGGVSPSQPPLV
jgi:hypothetical protein